MLQAKQKLTRLKFLLKASFGSPGGGLGGGFGGPGGGFCGGFGGW